MRLSRQKKPPAPPQPQPPAATAPTGFGRRTRLPPLVKDTAPSKRRLFKARPAPKENASGHGGAVGVALVGFGIGALMLARGKTRGA